MSDRLLDFCNVEVLFQPLTLGMNAEFVPPSPGQLLDFVEIHMLCPRSETLIFSGPHRNIKGVNRQCLRPIF